MATAKRYVAMRYGVGKVCVAAWDTLLGAYKVFQGTLAFWEQAPALAAAGDLATKHYGPATFSHTDYLVLPGRGQRISDYMADSAIAYADWWQAVKALAPDAGRLVV